MQAQQQRNQLELHAVLIEREALRYTPGGIAVIDAVLQHASVQIEAGHPRQLAMKIAARFAGDQAEKLAPLALGGRFRLAGFLAPRRKDSWQLRLHVTDFETDNDLTQHH
jgi:primosomal replication protein N